VAALSRPVLPSRLAASSRCRTADGPVQHEDRWQRERHEERRATERHGGEPTQAQGGDLQRVVVPAAHELPRVGGVPRQPDGHRDEHGVHHDVGQHRGDDAQRTGHVRRVRRQPARSRHDLVGRRRGQHDGRGRVDVAVQRHARGPPHPLPQVRVDHHDDSRGERGGQEQRSRERPHRAEVEVRGLRDPAAGPFDAGGELGVRHREDREQRGEPDRLRRRAPPTVATVLIKGAATAATSTRAPTHAPAAADPRPGSPHAGGAVLLCGRG
jgi:hypothetical protein